MADYLTVRDLQEIQESDFLNLFPEIEGIAVQYSDKHNWNASERVVNIPHLDSKISLLISLHEFAHVLFDTEESEREMQLIIDGLRKKFDVNQYERLCEILAEKEVRAWRFALGEGLNRFTKAYPQVDVSFGVEEIVKIKSDLETYYGAPAYVTGQRESPVLTSLSKSIFEEKLGNLLASLHKD